MNYLKVKNHEKFQAYKDGRPIHWIKLHISILDDYELEQLGSSEQLALIKIWCLAAKMNNKIPDDNAYLSRKLGFSFDLEQIKSLGFLIPYDIVPSRTEKSVRDGTISYTEREERREEPPPSPPLQGGVEKLISEFHLPDDWDPGLHDRWRDWVSVLCSRRRKTPPETLQSQVEVLVGLGQQKALATLNCSISGNYQGLVTPKGTVSLTKEQIDTDILRIESETAARKAQIKAWEEESEPEAVSKILRSVRDGTVSYGSLRDSTEG